MSKVRFQPYIGEFYNDSRYGIRLLVLGESHYDDDYSAGSDFTSYVVDQNAFVAGTSFFTKLTKLLKGTDADLTEEDRVEAWKHIAFYNYVQEIVGDTARISPTTEMWEAAREPFEEVVNRLKPNVILVLGVNLWNQMYNLPPECQVEWASVTHPSGGIKYEPSFAEIAKAITKVGGVYPPL